MTATSPLPPWEKLIVYRYQTANCYIRQAGPVINTVALQAQKWSGYLEFLLPTKSN